MPARKSISNTKKKLSTSVIVALIGLSGVVITAICGLIGILVQVNRASAPTVTAFENQSTITPESLPAFTPTKQADWSSLFYVGFEDVCTDSLIAPDYMLPLLGTTEGNTKYAEALNSGETNDWDIAYYYDESGYGSIFYIESRVAGQEWIRIENTFAITVFPQMTSGNMPVIENQTRCGEGDYRKPGNDGLIKLSGDLAAYSMYMNYPEADYYTLQPGEPEAFIFTPDCDTPGIYTLKIDIQFMYEGEKRTYPWTSPRHFVCPETFDHWGVTMFGDIMKVGEYQLKNSKYIPID